jgi:hypothetical protein
MSALVSYGSSDEEEETPIAPSNPPSAPTPTNGTPKGTLSPTLCTNSLH